MVGYYLTSQGRTHHDAGSLKPEFAISTSQSLQVALIIRPAVYLIHLFFRFCYLRRSYVYQTALGQWSTVGNLAEKCVTISVSPFQNSQSSLEEIGAIGYLFNPSLYALALISTQLFILL